MSREAIADRRLGNQQAKRGSKGKCSLMVCDINKFIGIKRIWIIRIEIYGDR